MPPLLIHPCLPVCLSYLLPTSRQASIPSQVSPTVVPSRPTKRLQQPSIEKKSWESTGGSGFRPGHFGASSGCLCPLDSMGFARRRPPRRHPQWQWLHRVRSWRASHRRRARSTHHWLEKVFQRMNLTPSKNGGFGRIYWPYGTEAPGR